MDLNSIGSSSSGGILTSRRLFFKCLKCPEKFTEAPQLTSHLKNSHISEMISGYRHFCHLCADSFPDELGMTMHIEHQHGPIHPCLFCPASFRNKIAWHIHTQRMHPTLYKEAIQHETSATAPKPHPQPQQKKKEETKNTSIVNVQKQYEYSHCNRTCTHCDLTFSDPSALESHREEIHGIDFQCEFCPAGYKFWTGQGLREHVAKMHSWDQRQKQAHSEEKEKERVLESLNGNGRRKRKRRKKNENVEESLERTWKCDICLGVFDKEIYLKKHLVEVHQLPEFVPDRDREMESILPDDGDRDHDHQDNNEHHGVPVPVSFCYSSNLNLDVSGNGSVDVDPLSVSFLETACWKDVPDVDVALVQLKPEPEAEPTGDCKLQDEDEGENENTEIMRKTKKVETKITPEPVTVKSEQSEFQCEELKNETPIENYENDVIIKSEFIVES